jgi:hypothetical protein
MRTKLTPVQKFHNLQSKVTNKDIIDSMIESYLTQTKSAVENILVMCETVRDVAEKLKDQEIDSNDVQYFCISVGLESFDSSQFRKYRCIADHADSFRKYLDRLPSAYTILYEITTLDVEKFEQLMTDIQINGRITIKDVRRLKGKSLNVSNSTSGNSSVVELSISFNPQKVSTKSLQLVRELFVRLQTVKDLKAVCTNEDVLELETLGIAA